MKEQRAFERFCFPCRIDLVHGGVRYPGRLENLSSSGALVDLDCELPLATGERFTLSIAKDPDRALDLGAEAIHSSSTLVGMRFAEPDETKRLRLALLVEEAGAGAQRLDDYLDRIRGYICEYRGSL